MGSGTDRRLRCRRACVMSARRDEADARLELARRIASAARSPVRMSIRGRSELYRRALAQYAQLDREASQGTGPREWKQ